MNTPSEILEALNESVSETFEGMTFSQVFDSVVQVKPPAVKADVISASISLPDPVGLRLSLVMTHFHVAEVFEELTGKGLEDVRPAVLNDFVNELTNTIAGHLNTRLAPEKDDLEIGLPVTPDNLTELLSPTREKIVICYTIELHEAICVLEPVS